MTARDDIKARRRRRLRQERWQADPRRPISLRTLDRLARMCRKFGPLPGDTISGSIAGRYEPGMFLASGPVAPLVMARHFGHMVTFGKWQPAVAPWSIGP